MAYYSLVLKRIGSVNLLSSSLRPLRVVSQPLSLLLSNTDPVRKYSTHDNRAAAAKGHVSSPSWEKIPWGSGHYQHVNFSTREKLKGSTEKLGLSGGESGDIDGGSVGLGVKAGESDGEENKSSYWKAIFCYCAA